MITRMATHWDAPQLALWWKLMIDEKQLPGMAADEVQVEKALVGFNDCIKMNGKNIYCIIAEVDGKGIGFMHSFIETPYWGTSDTNGHIGFCYVEKKYRHLHAGRNMGLKTEKFFIESGCKSATMSVTVDSGDAEAHTKLHGMKATFQILRKDF